MGALHTQSIDGGKTRQLAAIIGLLKRAVGFEGGTGSRPDEIGAADAGVPEVAELRGKTWYSPRQHFIDVCKYFGVDFAITDSTFKFADYVDETLKVRFLGGLGVLRGIYPSF